MDSLSLPNLRIDEHSRKEADREIWRVYDDNGIEVGELIRGPQGYGWVAEFGPLGGFATEEEAREEARKYQAAFEAALPSDKREDIHIESAAPDDWYWRVVRSGGQPLTRERALEEMRVAIAVGRSRKRREG